MSVTRITETPLLMRELPAKNFGRHLISKPLSCAQEFSSFLDDASEKTFLCAGMAESVQRYVFDGDAGKISLEMKNIVACASFLVEQKLVIAWLAEKDDEALRFQKLLMDEEEADQRRVEFVERENHVKQALVSGSSRK